MIVLNILLVANAHGAEFQKADHRRQNFLPSEALLSEPRVHRPPDFRQGFAEGDHAIEFLLVSNPAPAWMIAKLFAAFGVAAAGLKMAAFIVANPDVRPGGRNGERSYAFPFLCLVQNFSVALSVDEGFARTHAPNARFTVADIAQPGCLR